MTLDTDTKHKDEIIERPAKAWRNRWRALESYRVSGSSFWTEPGLVYLTTRTWPSKELAEQSAIKTNGNDLRFFGRLRAEYLGAFPEGVRP